MSAGRATIITLMLIITASILAGCASEEEKAIKELLEWANEEQELQEQRSRNWQVDHYRDPISDEIDLHLWRGANKDSDPGYLTITANCSREVRRLQLDVNVLTLSWGDDLGTSEVTIRFGDENPSTEFWTWRETNNLPGQITETVLEPPRSRSVDYLNRIAAGESLAVRYTESDGVHTHTPVFDTEGLSDALNLAVEEYCVGTGAKTGGAIEDKGDGVHATRDVEAEIENSIQATVEALASTVQRVESQRSTLATATTAALQTEVAVQRAVQATLTAQVESTTTNTVILRPRDVTVGTRTLVPTQQPPTLAEGPRTSMFAGTTTPASTKPGSPVGENCDQLLRNQLVFQRGASTAGRMNEVIRQIQAQRDECAREIWNPRVDDSNAASGCFGGTIPALGDPLTAKVGNLAIPRTLYAGFTDPDTVRPTSGRDSDNIIIIYWSMIEGETPADRAACWLFISRFNAWSEE